MTSGPFYRSWERPCPAPSMALGAQISFGVFFAALLEEFGESWGALPGRSSSTPSATAPSPRSPAASPIDGARVPIVFCFSYGAVGALVPAVVADFFGRGHAGGLVGLIFTMAGSMSAWGPIGAGFIYDHTGS